MAEPLLDTEVWTAIERLGGWAVVVWIVVWLTRRWENRMDAITKDLLEQAKAITAQTSVIGQLAAAIESHRAFSQDAVTRMTHRLGEVGTVLKSVADRLKNNG